MMADDLRRVVRVGGGARLERQFQWLYVTHPHISTKRVRVDSRRRPKNTYRVPGFVLKIIVHTLFIQYSNSAGSVPGFNITKCELGQESAWNGC